MAILHGIASKWLLHSFYEWAGYDFDTPSRMRTNTRDDYPHPMSGAHCG